MARYVKVSTLGVAAPRAQEFCYDTGAAVARSFGDLPAFQGALIHTEIRDHTAPSFHPIDKDKYRKDVGGEIPSQIVSSRGVGYKTLADFPANRVIPDNYPILDYYRWFWKNGDGWNTLHDRVDEGLKANLSPTRRQNFFTWFDPAVRAPSVWGSGGKLDFINQWTYDFKTLKVRWKGSIGGDGRGIVLSRNGYYTASVIDDGIHIYKTRSGRCVRILGKTAAYASTARAVAFSSDGKTLIDNGGKNALHVWSLATGKLKRTLPGKADAFSRDGKIAVTFDKEKKPHFRSIKIGQ